MDPENLFFGGIGVGMALTGFHEYVNILGAILAVFCALSSGGVRGDARGDDEG